MTPNVQTKPMPSSILDLLPDHIFWLDVNGCVVGCNQKQAEFFDFKSTQELEGKNVFDLAKIMGWPDSIATAIRNNDLQVMQSRKPNIVEETMLLRSGEPRQYLSFKHPWLGKNNEVLGVIGIAHDITELTRLQTELTQAKEKAAVPQLVLDNIAENIYWSDLEGRVLGCNRKQAKIFGFDSPEELIGKDIFEIAKIMGWPEAVANQVRQNDLEVIRTRKNSIVEESGYWQGKKQFVLSYKHPWIDENDTVLGVVGVSLDITERKQFEMELEQAKNAAEAANNAKSEFLANLSHDLRTPLSSLVSLNSYIANKTQDQETHPFALDAVECAQQLLHLIDEMLEVAKTDAGQFTQQEKVFSLPVLIRQLMKLIQPAARQKQLDLQINYAADAPEIICSKYQLIQAILLNLLSNAVKFTHTGSVQVLVSLVSKNNTEAVLKLSVKDTGIGIEPAHHQKIFERFYRLNAAYKGLYTGHGLGLYAVKQFSDILHATITLQSAKGSGTNIEIDVPVKLATECELVEPIGALTQLNLPKLPKSAAVSSIETSNNKHSIKLLLVEDNEIAQTVAKLALVDLGAVDIATTGQQAITLACHNTYDLIFLDIGLPDISGLDVAKAIRQFEQQQRQNPTPIIAITAHLNNFHEALMAGIQQVLYKPLSKEKAEIILRNWLDIAPRKFTHQAIDMAQAEKITSNKALALTMLEEFIKTLPQDLQHIKEAHAANDKDLLKDRVHYLNGSASYAGVPLLKKACNSLESALNDNFSDAEIQELLEDLNNEAEQVLQHFEKLDNSTTF